MAQTDNFTFAKSEEVQGVSKYTPYSEKTFNNINDINSGVYSNNSGLTLVQFDASSIFNSSLYTDITDMFLTVPIVTVAESWSATTAQTAPTAGYALCALKNSYQSLVHQVEIQSGGKIVNDSQPFINIARGFKLLSQLTPNDLKNLGTTMGIADTLDSPYSTYFATTADRLGTGAVQSGVGLTNNQPFANGANASLGFQTALTTSQYAGVSNDSLQKRISRYTSLVNNGSQNIYASSQAASGSQPFICTSTTLTNEFRPFYTTTASGSGVSGSRMIWYDVAILPLRYLCDVCDKMGLVKKADFQIRAYFNTGVVGIPVANPNSTTLQYGVPTASTFANTCPITVNHLPATSANGGLVTGVTAIVAGVFIQKSPTTAVSIPTNLTASVNLSGVSHPMPSCRLYYSQIKLDPALDIKYLTENTAKELVWENYIFNQYSNITSGSTFSQLVQSGIKNPLGILIMPFISSATPTAVLGSTPLGLTQYGSPYDPAGGLSGAPLSLTNLQVLLGGRSVLNSSSLFYTFENFIEQVGIAETTVPEMGLNQGIFDQKWWEANRMYYVDLARGTEADKATQRNLSISFTNNSGVSIDILVFTFYLNRGVINVANGMMTM
jgi:hypothetical protein